jgi:hypothetical protein
VVCVATGRGARWPETAIASWAERSGVDQIRCG